MNAPAHIGNIKGIDGLRALAVVSVILYHMNQSWLPGGFVGVDVFFVISGYVVTRSIQSREWRNAAQFFATFFARRIARIYPALVLCLVVTAALHCLFVPKAWLNDTAAKAGVAAFFGLSNIALVFFDDGYFSPRSEFNPFTHTWSLGVEEQFYLLFAFVWWVFHKNYKLLAGFLLVSVLASFWWCSDVSASSPSKAYYLLPSRWWELSAGALLAQFHQLSSAQLSSAQLSSAQLSSAQLSSAQLSSAQLSSAQLRVSLLAASGGWA
jgi:peptidoglycan/LPS O-acetylase OafA/YrhL